MLDFEYALFTKEDPIKLLKDAGSSLSIPRKVKYAPHVRRASAMVKKCCGFRDILTKNDNDVVATVIATTFSTYFGKKIDCGPYLAIPSDVSKDYIEFIEVACKDFKITHKYMESIIKVILHHSDHIDAFVKAFLSIRLAQGELDKLKSN